MIIAPIIAIIVSSMDGIIDFNKKDRLTHANAVKPNISPTNFSS